MVHSIPTMANPGFGMYSNNNYLPDIGQFSNNSIISQPRCRSQNLAFPGSTGQGGQFTFAVPTQASSCIFTPAQSHQPRGIYSNPLSYPGIAPGIGTSWQHSVPNQMPWGDDGIISQMNMSGISTFSATPTTSIYSSIPSCSITPMRPKRHSSTDIESEAPKSKCLVTEEKMAAKMEGLSLDGIGICTPSPSMCDNQGYQLEPDILDFEFSEMVSSSNTCTTMSDDWKRFRDIEDRLKAESDEEDLSSEDGGVKVHISQSLAKSLLESSPLLPQRILNDLNKPCMEIVLWKSPGGFDKDNLKTSVAVQSVLASSSCDQTNQSTTITQTISTRSITSKDTMDTEVLENIEADMDL